MSKLRDIKIQYLKGVGPKKAAIFKSIGISNIEDLFYYFPKRYQDRTSFLNISQLADGQVCTIKGTVLATKRRVSFKRRGLNIFEAVVTDGSGKISCVWFSQPYLKEYIKPQDEIILYGKIRSYRGRLQMNAPEFEVVEEDASSEPAGIVPVYTLAGNMTQRYFRTLLRSALKEFLPQVIEFIPYDVRSRNKLLNLPNSLTNIHFPQDHQMRNLAYQRLSFEEFLLFQIPIILLKLSKKESKGFIHREKVDLVSDFINSLPFKLTAGQEGVMKEIRQDLLNSPPMQRLLQGDVGSGKTVVATAAAMIVVGAGHQVAFMVPTELLARQHFEKISTQIASMAYHGKRIKIGLLTSSLSKSEKSKIYASLSAGSIDILIGTHALIEEDIRFKELGLVIIDEQHKFGVGQRALLSRKGSNPDLLIMTATPIPRTLAITMYGDLDISVLNELPPGRPAIETVHFTSSQRPTAYSIAKQHMDNGGQVYIVYPAIEDSDKLELEGAKNRFEELKRGQLKDYKLGLIHGQMTDIQQNRIMFDFKDGKLDALVSTTILEVGIDIPNASCIIIERAERFGLSQLHQLRGRIGRGSKPSVCILITDPETEEARARMQAMVKYNDGFKIAEEDLKIRGPGEFFGQRQHGLSELKIANPLTQMRLLKLARQEAIRIIGRDPVLADRSNLLLKQELIKRFPGYERLKVIS
ncbi:MAG: ATP-dependent DNA helicase RecG [Candidatus Omnitrophota bacterium]|jgi:ATP-dependent DNA helicase RecG|nr:MAG: ATP-dependent DNA helicase RecG [Candidatus Omnitrophota bacterium]